MGHKLESKERRRSKARHLKSEDLTGFDIEFNPNFETLSHLRIQENEPTPKYDRLITILFIIQISRVS